MAYRRFPHRALFRVTHLLRVAVACSGLGHVQIRRRHKRVHILLRDFARATSGTDTLLVIAGTRENDTDAIVAEGRALLGERVRFLPDIPRAAMPNLYRAADAFVLPSLSEMFGIVLLEALATGLPVLCNDTPDFRAIVGPGGLHANLQAEGGLAAGITALLQPETLARLTGAGRDHMKRFFSETAVINAILGMYHSVANGIVR